MIQLLINYQVIDKSLIKILKQRGEYNEYDHGKIF
jgi:hypothetical protein